MINHDELSKFAAQAESIAHLLSHGESFTTLSPTIIESSLWLLCDLLEKINEIIDDPAACRVVADTR